MQTMGELPVFTCQAHVFTIDPATRKSWVPASSKAVDINFYYNSNKECYRIVSIEDSEAEKKVIINSTITEKMAFKQTSQKFGQWADSKSNGVFGLGFNSEVDLAKFVNQFKQCVEATRQSAGGGTAKRAIKPMGSFDQCTTKLNGDAVVVSSGGSGVGGGGGVLCVSSLPMTQTALRGTLPLPAAPPIFPLSGSAASPDSSLQQQLYLAQAQIRRLEQELSIRRQIPSAHTTEADSSNSPAKRCFDSSDIRDGLDRVQLFSSDAHTVSDFLPKPVITGSKTDFEVPDASETESSMSSNSLLLRLHTRLGNVLREATELHSRINSIIVLQASQSPTHS